MPKSSKNLLESKIAELEIASHELDAFSYSVSHDLRAPLRAISGFSGILMEDYSSNLPQEGKELLERTMAAAKRMGELIDGLLEISRLTRTIPTKTQLDLSSLSSEILNLLKKNEPNRKVSLSIAPKLLVQADPQLMRTVLYHLLHNAWKFSSTCLLSTIELGSTFENEQQVFYIKDNGAGFDMRHMNKLFGTFQRLHSETEFPGHGIGLAAAHRIILRHGGKIWAQGQVDGGATFYFTL